MIANPTNAAGARGEGKGYTYYEVRKVASEWGKYTDVKDSSTGKVIDRLRNGRQNGGLSVPEFKDEQPWRRTVGAGLMALFILGGAFATYYMVNHAIPKVGVIGSGALVGSVSVVGAIASALLIRNKKLTKRDAELLDQEAPPTSAEVFRVRSGKTEKLLGNLLYEY